MPVDGERPEPVAGRQADAEEVLALPGGEDIRRVAIGEPPGRAEGQPVVGAEHDRGGHAAGARPRAPRGRPPRIAAYPTRTAAARPAGYSNSTPIPASSPTQSQSRGRRARVARMNAAKRQRASWRCPKSVGPSEPAIVPSAERHRDGRAGPCDEALCDPSDQEGQGEQREPARDHADRPERPFAVPHRLRRPRRARPPRSRRRRAARAMPPRAPCPSTSGRGRTRGRS